MVIANSFFDQYGIVILITDNEYNGVRSNMTLDDTVAMMLSAINATATPVTEH
jgi:ribose 5-phosphate isomerase RpiB